MNQAGRRPNVIMIVIDDLGWRDLVCCGSDFYETPNLDRLASQGMRFSQAYAGAPNCSPTRSSLLTGKAPARVGVTMYIGGHNVGRLADVRSFPQLPRNEYSLARAFADQGYRTWHVGKWHLGPQHSWPKRHGFQVNVGGCDWGHPRSYFSPYECPTLSDGPEGEYLTDRLTDEAIALMRNACEDDDPAPFLLNLWHYAVHTPLQAPPDLVAKYERKAQELGLDKIEQVVDGGPPPYWHADDTVGRRRVRQGDPRYAAMVENLDTNIGRLLEAVQELSIGDDTVVVFTSDNGGLHAGGAAPTANTPLAEGKGWLEEGGIRVPLMVRYPPVVEPGTVRDTPACSADLYPTLLGLCGLAPLPRQHRDGVDLGPVLRGGDLPERPLFWHFPHYANAGSSPASAVRVGRWKLVRDYERERTVLRDLVADEAETTDLAENYPEVVERLSKLLDEWLDDVDAQIPNINEYAPFGEFAAHSPAPA